MGPCEVESADEDEDEDEDEMALSRGEQPWSVRSSAVVIKSKSRLAHVHRPCVTAIGTASLPSSTIDPDEDVEIGLV